MIKGVVNKVRRSARERHFRNALKSFDERNAPGKDSDLIICWELGGYASILAKNAMFSKGLHARGYRTHFILCDGISEACIKRGVEVDEKFENWSDACGACQLEMNNRCKKYNVNYSYASEYIDEAAKEEFHRLSEEVSIKEIKGYKYLDVSVGQLALISTIRYFKGQIVSIDELPESDERIYRKYFYAALVNTIIADNVYKKHKPISLYTSHGVFVDYGPPVLVGVNLGVNVISWSSGFKPFNHYFIAPVGNNTRLKPSMSNTEWDERKAKLLTDAEQKKLDEFFNDRYFNDNARDLTFKSNPEDVKVLREKIGVNNDKPIVCMFLHVNWDAVFDSGPMLFESQNVWLIESITRMIGNENVNWLIRVHPGETEGGTVLMTTDILNEAFPSLPEHIKVINHDAEINSYGLFHLIDAGITVFGTVASELPVFGKPMILLGEGLTGNRGFSIDVKSRDHYFKIIDEAHEIKPLSEEQVNLAKKYAYIYFLQRQIPLNIINKSEGHWGNIDVKRLNELLPGNDSGMDKICESIVNGVEVLLD